MDLALFEAIDEYRYRPCQQENVILYGNKELITAMDDKVLEQITNVSKLPGLFGPAMTMPDAHWGYGFPIGGVAAFDPEAGGVISAGGVGFDISCGIRCLLTNLKLADAVGHLESLADVLFKTVPSGVGAEGQIRLNKSELDEVMMGGAAWAVKKGYGSEEELYYVEEQGQMAGAVPENVSDHAKERQLNEMGTLGSGNHYLEVQVVQYIHDQEAAKAFGLHEGQLIVSIHCGSRGLGHQIGSDYLITLAKAAAHYGVQIPERELAAAPILSPEGQKYLGAMHAGINCALANRQIIAHLTRKAFESVIPHAVLKTLFDVSHNTCKKERHHVDGMEKELYVHRKGSTRALPPMHPELPDAYKEIGQPVVIGGSMGTSSYILAGNPRELNQAFASAAHGAGRQVSRRQALKKWQGPQLIKALGAQGILIRSKTMRGVAEEAPAAYKDIDTVITVTEKAGLARRVACLKPLVCIKG